MFKSILQLILRFLARRIIQKYQPEIIGITGSVGKTSAKEAITTVLGSKFSVRSNIKNYNNEFGLPLTILGLSSPGKSLWGWFKLFIRALMIIIRTNDYPKILVLEMGVDHPGDMDYLNSMVKLKIAVITTIGISHLANFGTSDKIKLEKKKILDTLDSKSGWAILNFDNDKIKEIGQQLEYQTISYGFSDDAVVSAHNLDYSFNGEELLSNLQGLSFKIKYQDSYIPVLLPGALSRSTVYAALAGASVGFAYNMNGVEISQALKNFQSPSGRMKLLAGINGSMIIDDTYNASPQSTLNALETLNDIKLPELKRRWIILGDMLELGPDSEKGHLEVGHRVSEIKNARLAILGQESLYISMGARRNGMKETNIFHCNNHQEIIEMLQRELTEGDLVLVKGSQGMRMEKIVAQILANPEEAEKLLVRQSPEWLK